MNALAFGIALTLVAYLAGRALARRWPSPWTTPVLSSAVIVVALLALFGHEVADYAPAREAFEALLGPATVALAVPMYRHRALLLQHTRPIVLALLAAAVTTVFVACAMAAAFGLAGALLPALATKSVTAAVAVPLSRLAGGDASLAAACVIATGMLGAALGPWWLDRIGIRDPLARGLALGGVSHGQGTAQALLEGSACGAMAALAMTSNALLAAFAAPLVLAAWR